MRGRGVWLSVNATPTQWHVGSELNANPGRTQRGFLRTTTGTAIGEFAIYDDSRHSMPL